MIFFFNDTATTEIYTLSLHDALPISGRGDHPHLPRRPPPLRPLQPGGRADRKSTRLNSSHGYISYAVFCLKKKINITEVACIRDCAACGMNVAHTHARSSRLSRGPAS